MRSHFAEEFTATDEKIREIFWCRKFGIGRKKQALGKQEPFSEELQEASVAVNIISSLWD